MSPAPALRNPTPADPFDVIRIVCGFVPNLFHAQSALPCAVESEAQLIAAVLLNQGTISRQQKDALLLAVANAAQNAYCAALFRGGHRFLSDGDSALAGFAAKLARYGPWVSGNDIAALRQSGFDDGSVLEAVVTVALGQLLCTLADALRPPPDSGFTSPIASQPPTLPDTLELTETQRPYLSDIPCLGNDYQPFAFLREQFGFVPNLFHAQAQRPEVVEAEVEALRSILLAEDAISRVQKEKIVLAVSAANLNTCCVAVQTEILSTLGVPPEESDEIVQDHDPATMPDADKSLLGYVRLLARYSGATAAPPAAMERFAALGFTEPQILEAVAMAAWTNFLNTVQFGLGTVPDFAPRHVFIPNKPYPFPAQGRPTPESSAPSRPVDPDAEFVARVQAGETDAFEELVRRHFRRIFGTLSGILGNTDAARDATQDVFLKAFEHIRGFQGRSKFSTWLTSIAINSGTELLRHRKGDESLDEGDDDEGFRPRLIQAWSGTPEQLLAASQIRDLVRQAVLRLPQKYRVAVLLRDINQLSTEEAAASLGIGVPAFKARILRGRLMLRESLAPHFARQARSAKC